MRAIIAEINNQNENFMQDFDKDGDGFLTIEEMIELVTTIATNASG